MFMLVPALTTVLIIISEISGTNGQGYENYLRVSDASKNLPQKNDLIIYLKTLRRIVEFCSDNKNEVDLNFVFGIFLINVNLKSVLNKKPFQNPKLLRYIKLMLKEIGDVMDFFNRMVRENHDQREDINKMIISLFSNETQWIKQVHRFDKAAMKATEEDWQLEDFGIPTWANYLQIVRNYENLEPTPPTSDMCISSLTKNPVFNSKSSNVPRCNVFEQCHEMLINGTDFGYSLSHRLLFLLQARYARGCSIFSSEVDKKLVKQFCELSYDEADYIANNSYGVVDLMLEQMCLCALGGHPQLLQRHWLSDLINFQTPYGCFANFRMLPTSQLANVPRSSISERTWQLDRKPDEQDIMGGLCNSHVTSVAAGTYSAAIRYILEVYY